MMEKTWQVLKGTGRCIKRGVQFFCIIHCVTTYGVSIVLLSGVSMEPTIYGGSVYLAERMSVRKQKLKRGDIVGAKDMSDRHRYICKRIVALEGESVYIDKMKTRIWVPKGHVWLEGDNKNHSKDSREYGPVPYGLIHSKLLYKLYSKNGLKVNMSKDK